MVEWRDISEQLEKALRLRSLPIGLKLLENAKELDKIKHRKPDQNILFCQLLTQARTFGWTIGFTSEDLVDSICAHVVGLRAEAYEPFLLAVGEVWFKDKKTALQKYAPENFPCIPHKFEAAVLSPLAAGRIDPDLIILYGNPAQAMRFINGVQWENYEKMEISSCGESACSDSIGLSYTTGKPKVAIPCFGERRFGHVQDDELIMVLPSEYVDTLLRGLDALDKKGARYPISFWGAQTDFLPGFPPSFQEAIREDQEAMKGKEQS